MDDDLEDLLREEEELIAAGALRNLKACNDGNAAVESLPAEAAVKIMRHGMCARMHLRLARTCKTMANWVRLADELWMCQQSFPELCIQVDGERLRERMWDSPVTTIVLAWRSPWIQWMHQVGSIRLTRADAFLLGPRGRMLDSQCRWNEGRPRAPAIATPQYPPVLRRLQRIHLESPPPGDGDETIGFDASLLWALSDGQLPSLTSLTLVEACGPVVLCCLVNLLATQCPKLADLDVRNLYHKEREARMHAGIPLDSGYSDLCRVWSGQADPTMLPFAHGSSLAQSLTSLDLETEHRSSRDYADASSRCSRLPAAAVKGLCSSLQKYQKLSSLTLDNALDGCRTLCKALEQLPLLEECSLNSIKLGAVASTALASLWRTLASRPSMRMLSVLQNGLSALHERLLFDALAPRSDVYVQATRGTLLDCQPHNPFRLALTALLRAIRQELACESLCIPAGVPFASTEALYVDLDLLLPNCRLAHVAAFVLSEPAWLGCGWSAEDELDWQAAQLELERAAADVIEPSAYCDETVVGLLTAPGALSAACERAGCDAVDVSSPINFREALGYGGWMGGLEGVDGRDLSAMSSALDRLRERAGVTWDRDTQTWRTPDLKPFNADVLDFEALVREMLSDAGGDGVFAVHHLLENVLEATSLSTRA